MKFKNVFSLIQDKLSVWQSDQYITQSLRPWKFRNLICVTQINCQKLQNFWIFSSLTFSESAFSKSENVRVKNKVFVDSACSLRISGESVEEQRALDIHMPDDVRGFESEEGAESLWNVFLNFGISSFRGCLYIWVLLVSDPINRNCNLFHI